MKLVAAPRPKTPARRRSRRPKPSPKATFGKLSLREIIETKDGYSWPAFLVQGFKNEDGRHGRKKFSSRDDALAWIATKNVELRNADTALHNVVTRLSKAQVEEAEGAFNRLAGRYSLGEAVDYFLRTFAQPDDAVRLDHALSGAKGSKERAAIVGFIEARERDGVRPRSLVQLKSTISNFVGFATLAKVPENLRSEIDRVRAELVADRAATLAEVIRALPDHLREQARAASEDLDSVLDLLRVPKLAPALRDAVATIRDSLEARRRPTDKELASALVEGVPAVSVPAVHEIGSPDVEAFLRGLRSKDGTSPASRKTWNNARADLHTFFAWCADPSRRWCASNPATSISKKKLGRGVPEILTVAQCRDLMNYVAEFEGGALARYFALAIFAGLRTGPGGELVKLARHANRSKLIDLANGVIRIPPEIAKTHQFRTTEIRPVLHTWLTRFDGEILPPNSDRRIKHIRAKFFLGHDVLRHTFFSYLVGTDGSVEKAALQGGNTEKVLRRHYLNMVTATEAAEFWQILPPGENADNIVQMISA
jgi:hypothetical protein